MDWLSASAVAIHLIFSAAWIGAIVFFTLGILPLAREGTINAGVLRPVVSTLQMVVRVSAVFILASGGYLAGARYTVDRLLETGEGHLVITMIALWFVLAALSEYGCKKIANGLQGQKVREPAHHATNIFRVASLTGILLFVNGALLSVPIL